MSSESDRRLIEFVAQSPRLCAAHDKAAWVGLFAADGEVNDPVGSAPHRGHEAIGRFWDTFIAPNHIAMDVEHDIVCGMSVMRDLTLTSTMSTGLAIPVPMHLRYDLIEQDGALKIRKLMAHWELPVLLRQQLGSLKGWVTSMKLTPQLLGHQGFGGLMGFMRGLGGRGRDGKATARTFLAALAAGNPRAAAAFVASDATLESPPGTTTTVEGLGGLRDLVVGKVIGSGDYATATVHVGPRRGVAVFRFDATGSSLSNLQVFS